MKSHTERKWLIRSIVMFLLLALAAIGVSSCYESNTDDAPLLVDTQLPPGNGNPLSASDATLSTPLDTSGVVSVFDISPGIDLDSYDATSIKGGVVVYNGDGTFTYTPPAAFEGEDTFTYTIKDSAGKTAKGTVTVTINSAVISNGEAYYAANCAICHAAGVVDTTTAFAASDLSLSGNPLTRDLTMYGGQYELMGAFYDIPQPNVDELKAYLANLMQ